MRLRLTINWFAKKLLASLYRAGTFTLPSFTEGDIVPFEIQLVEPDDSAEARWTTPDISNLAITLTVEDPTAGTVFVSQPTWNKDVTQGIFYALVDFSTGDLNTWLGASTSKSGTLKIKRTDADGGVVTVLQETVTIVANLSGATPANPLIGQTLLTVELASQMFAKKIMDPGDTLTFKDVDGTVTRTLGVYKDGSVVIKQDDLDEA